MSAFTKVQKNAAEKLEGSSLNTVEITAQDGIKLVGHWRFCKNPKRIMIAMHGWRSSWSRDFGAISDFWERQDCSVLYAEQRGQNASGGNYMGFGLIERYDVLKWLDWVNQRCGSRLPVYLAGVSMGATTVLMAAGLDVPQVTRVAMALKARGLEVDPAVYTVEDLERQLLALRKGGAPC